MRESIMNFEEFKGYVVENIRTLLPAEWGGVSVTTQEVIKANNLRLTGLTVLPEGAHISPTVYLDSKYQEYMDGKAEDTILNEIAEIIIKNMPEKDGSNFPYPDIAKQALDFNFVKPRLFMVLLNYQKNEELLKDVVHRRMLDLAIVCKVSLSCEEGLASFYVKEHFLSAWGITEQELFDFAKESSSKVHPPVYGTMPEMFTEFGEVLPADIFDGIPKEQQMYIVTNIYKALGASAILYEDVLSKLAEELNSDLYIIPASIHECIAMSAAVYTEPQALVEMINEVNSTQVSPEEVLSDSLYIYNRETGTISKF